LIILKKNVIDELNDENIKYLGEYIVKRLDGQTFSTEEYDEDFFVDIADENGDFTITPENVGGLIGDKESMNRMMRDDLDDLKNELHSMLDVYMYTVYLVCCIFQTDVTLLRPSDHIMFDVWLIMWNCCTHVLICHGVYLLLCCTIVCMVL
jgi:hypothetical protein